MDCALVTRQEVGILIQVVCGVGFSFGRGRQLRPGLIWDEVVLVDAVEVRK